MGLNMERTPREVIQAIIASLEMIRNAHSRNAYNENQGTEEWALQTSLERAAQQHIDLIRTEAAGILSHPPVRHLSDGTSVEMVKPFSSNNPPL